MLQVIALLYYSFVVVDTLGRQNFECPDGFYLNSISSMFDDGHRMYNFGCAPLTNGEVKNEKCEPGKISSTSANDMYMSCENDQYVSGISILEDSQQQAWTLLCCHSSEVKIVDDCPSTIFLNDFKKGFTFACGAKHILRKWQSVFDEKKNDRRWWLQTCPYTVEKSPANITNMRNTQVSYSRKVAYPFDESRMESSISKHDVTNNTSIDEEVSHFENFLIGTHLNLTDTDQTNMTVKHLVLSENATDIMNTTYTTLYSTASVETTTMKSSMTIDSSSPRSDKNISSTEEAITKSHRFASYDDYYDVHTATGSVKLLEKTSKGKTAEPKVADIFKDLHNVFKNIQDGLVLAQWMLSNNDDNSDKEKEIKSSGLVRKDDASPPKLSFVYDSKPQSRNSNNKPKSIVQTFAELIGISLPSRK